MQEDKARRGDIQRQSEQRNHQENRREHREFDGATHLQADQKNDDGERDVETEQQIEDEARQRQEHHHDNGDHPHGHEHVRVFDELGRARWFRNGCHRDQRLRPTHAATPLAR